LFFRLLKKYENISFIILFSQEIVDTCQEIMFLNMFATENAMLFDILPYIYGCKNEKIIIN
jgi:hypothetical protein